MSIPLLAAAHDELAGYTVAEIEHRQWANVAEIEAQGRAEAHVVAGGKEG